MTTWLDKKGAAGERGVYGEGYGVCCSCWLSSFAGIKSSVRINLQVLRRSVRVKHGNEWEKHELGKGGGAEVQPSRGYVEISKNNFAESCNWLQLALQQAPISNQLPCNLRVASLCPGTFSMQPGRRRGVGQGCHVYGLIFGDNAADEGQGKSAVA